VIRVVVRVPFAKSRHFDPKEKIRMKEK